MLIAAALAAALVFYLFTRWKKDRTEHATDHDSTPALDAFLREALEEELANGIGLRGASSQERRPLTRTLANEPDPAIVAKIEDAVKAVELEYVRYAHESDVEVTMRVRWENGQVGAVARRLPFNDVPSSVRTDFQSKAATRAFRTWSFPWQRATAL